ncbi:MAG: RNA methyltransferase [Planctomycetes bacterium]|nr:RNA methyltransferase [Planctomycetota bacterium]
MAEVVTIEDVARDPRVDAFRSVRERDLKGRDGLFIGEGPLTVERMLALPGVTRSLLVVANQAERYRALAGAEVTIYAASEAALSAIVGFAFHRGVLALGDRASFDGRSLADLLRDVRRRSTLLVIDGVTNVDNIGLLFRNAAAFACDGVVLSESCHDPLYRKALRVSLGHVLSLPFARVADWSGALAELRGAGYDLAVAALGPGSIALDDYEVPDRVALVVGQEREGVSAISLGAASRVLRIPMAPGVDSLNVAAASAVCLHRLARGERH